MAKPLISVTASSLILMWCCSTALSQTTTSAQACTSVDLDTNSRATCDPCPTNKWFELVLKQRSETDNETTCFNNFPLGTNLPFPCPQDLTKGNPYPKLDYTKTPRGFIMSELPFFRYNTKLPTKAKNCNCPSKCASVPSTAPPPTGPLPEENMDVGEVENYYKDGNTKYEVDFQILEWPGRTSEKQTEFLKAKVTKECAEGKFKSHKPALCSNPDLGNFHMLKFERESSKLLHYPCNKEEGTSIVALGLMAVYNETEIYEHPHSKIFLSYSNLSIFNAHGHPLYVSDIILNQMARELDAEPRAICRRASEEPKDCDFTKDLARPLHQTASDCDWRQKFFEDRGDLIMDKDKCQPFIDTDTACESCRKVNKSLSGDLRTVLDFTFVQGRLLLGMRCGIVIVGDFLNKQLNIRAAQLLTAKGYHKNTFPPINKISSSFCCQSSGCRTTIIAAYSSFANRGFNSAKELFVSFDLGETFKVKLLAEPRSALNLIWGMYKLYSNWVLYYQLLEKPDAEDLRDQQGEELHSGYVDLRSVADWDSLTLMHKERRFLFGGDSSSDSHSKDLAARKKALRKYIRLRTAGALGRYVRYRDRHTEIELDLSPMWLQNEIKSYRKSSNKWSTQWTDSNCDNVPECRKNFLNDPAVAYFLGDADITVKAPRKSVEESFCDQILSLVVLEEEDSLYVLCRVGFGDFSSPYQNNSRANAANPTSCSSREAAGEYDAKPSCTYPLHPNGTQYSYNPCVNPIRYYAIYSFSVKENLPFVLMEELRSERLFTCKPSITPLDWDGCKNLRVQPELIRVPSSVYLLVKNCQDILYYSPNGGRTIFNTQFYAVESQFAGDSNVAANCTQSDDCTQNQNQNQNGTTSDKRQLMYRLKSLNIPPLIAISPGNTVVLMTMRNIYAYGLLGVNKEFKMIVGEIFPTISDNIISEIRSNDFVFPVFSHSGLPFFGVALKLIYSHNAVISCELYSSRHGMRLVHMDFFFYQDIAYFYGENQDLDSEARSGDLGVDMCHTYQFSANPKNVLLDVDETGVVEVKSYDARPTIHLGLVSSEEKSIIVDVSFVDRERKMKEHLAHDWDIHIQAIRNYKPRITALVDSFFGAENNNMFGFYTEVGLANNVMLRCHVQPSATVSVQIACRDKKMVVHEDEHRPQCMSGKFSKSAFQYRLKKGQFDPSLAGYWMELDDREGRGLITLDRETGDLIITYDYLRFGCPLEPYKDDNFIPDLRIVTADTNYNSSEGKKYEGSFLLIELFGASGFQFHQTFNDYGCTYLPMNLTNMTEDWVTRQRMFRIAYGRQISFSSVKIVEDAKSHDELNKLEYGNKLFTPDAVDHPINIVNRVTYRDCKQWRSFFLDIENQTYLRLDDEFLSDEVRKAHLDQQLPILERKGDNLITWNKRSQEVYIFMAIALDPTESLCEYYTIFGVHLPELAEIDALITLFVFILLILIWILMFVCGYLCRKSRIRTLCIQLERKRRLEEAAWKVVYQYEKLLQENENSKFEQEFQEFRESTQPAAADLDKQKEASSSRKTSRPNIHAQRSGTRKTNHSFSIP